MHLKTITVLTGLICCIACRKSDKNPEVNSSVDDCVVTKSLSDGTPIDGQYIIAYKSSDNTVSAGNRIGTFTNTLLQRNKILRQVFYQKIMFACH